MRERRKIVEMWRRGGAVALVTLVRVEGSSYRRVGARLLVGADGEYAGSISGGCLEAEVVRKAPWMVRSGAVVERYSTLFDDTAEIPYGLGCGGTVDLLIEPAGTKEFGELMEALEASLRGEERRVVTWLPENGAALRRVVCDVAAEAEVDGGLEERIEAPQRLVVFGAGDDAQPMVQMAALLGWNVVVVDGRPQWAKAERFPEARLVVVADGFEELDGLEIGARDAVVVMTHSYEQDRVWLAGALRCEPRYLGLLGARHRSALLVSETAAMLGWSVERACEGLFAPVGLDLGGDGAEAIALAVIAEIQACCEGKLGISRRMTPEMVEAQIADGGASRYLQAKCAL
jgi:xanthine/CO dehydrogenase XdhC/CoxF family maturation factor